MSIPSPIFWLGFYFFIVLTCCAACEFDAIRGARGINGEGSVFDALKEKVVYKLCSGDMSPDVSPSE